MLAADAEGREVCVSPKKKEGKVLLFGCDVKWRSGAAVVMKGSLALFLSRECASMLPRTLSSLDSSFPTLYKFPCARRWMWHSPPLPALCQTRAALEEMQEIAVPSAVKTC